MNKPLLCLLACWVAMPGNLLRAEMEIESAIVVCAKSSRFLAPAESSDRRQYAPDREAQMVHLALDVRPDFKQRVISATATLRVKAAARPVREIQLDAVDLKIHSVTGTQPIQAHQVTGDKLILTLAQPLEPGREAGFTVAYLAEPTSGLYFRTPDMGYKEGDTHLFTQGEAIEARHWYPCLDAPNQQFTSEVTCRVPAGMTVISNGRLVSETRDSATRLTTFHFAQEKPHANYLISLVAGYFKKLEDTCRDIPLAFYTPPSEFAHASNSFRHTKDMLAFFEKEIGVPYPWAKYDQVCVNDFVAGGMENTSATTLTDGTLFSEATENIRDSDGLVAHELAHQWFGDLVTCKDWSHLWLNEGFATYYETLYNGHLNGRDDRLYSLYHRARMITGMSDSHPIVRRNYGEPMEMFGYLVYPKAGWVLHMLRADLGEDLYRRCVKTYLERHQFGNVVTDDFRAVIEELSGRSFDQFFDQWLYHERQPELDISYSWDETTRLARVSIRQTQEVNASVLLFNFPLTLRFKGAFGTADCPIQVTRKEEDFYFPLESAPKLVRVDPGYTLLAKIKFTVPPPMLAAQLQDTADVVGRLLAIEQLSSRRDKDSLAQLKHALNHDPFYGVRVEASKALRAIHTEDALAALLESVKQPDARVRRQVVDDIGGFYADQACAAAQQVLSDEKNPAILSTAIQDLGGYAKPEVRALLLQYLNSDSYRNELADAAIRAVRLQDDPAYVSPLLETLGKRETQFTTRGFAQGLEALAYLARNEEDKDPVRQFLAGCVNHKKPTVRVASLKALGTLGDPRAIALLDRFASAGKDSPERDAAERAVASLRAARKPVDDFKNLRQEVLGLQKANRDLRKEIDDLKKKVEAGLAPRIETKSPKPKVQSPKANTRTK